MKEDVWFFIVFCFIWIFVCNCCVIFGEILFLVIVIIVYCCFKYFVIIVEVVWFGNLLYIYVIDGVLFFFVIWNRLFKLFFFICLCSLLKLFFELIVIFVDGNSLFSLFFCILYVGFFIIIVILFLFLFLLLFEVKWLNVKILNIIKNKIVFVINDFLDKNVFLK